MTNHEIDFMALFYARVPGHAIGHAELPHALVSFGVMFQRQLVRVWTLPEMLDACEERVEHMRGLDIPHDAYCVVSYPHGADCLTGTVFLPITLARHVTGVDRDEIEQLIQRGITFVIPQVYNRETGGIKECMT